MLYLLLKRYGIKDFSLGEVTRFQTNIPEELHTNIIPTISLLQKIRDKLNKPIYINSTYRSHAYNKHIKGSKNSLHIEFNAIDFYVSSYDPIKLQVLFNRIDKNEFQHTIFWNNKETLISNKVLGIGLYSNFIHIDTRGLLGRSAPAKWRG